MHSRSQAISILFHVGVVLALLHLAAVQETPRNQRLVSLTHTKLTYHLPSNESGGGGGRSATQASKGEAPRTRLIPLLLPTTRRSETVPLLPVEPAIPGMVDSRPAPALLGDPGALPGPPSDGPGGPGGIGSSPNGTGAGPNGGIRNGGSSNTGSTTPPRVIFMQEPEFTEEARKARLQGTVLLDVEIDENGRIGEMQVVHPLGLGLDERAIEAVRKWRFRPALRDGKPVRTRARVEVNFRLL